MTGDFIVRHANEHANGRRKGNAGLSGGRPFPFRSSARPALPEAGAALLPAEAAGRPSTRIAFDHGPRALLLYPWQVRHRGGSRRGQEVQV